MNTVNIIEAPKNIKKNSFPSAIFGYFFARKNFWKCRIYRLLYIEGCPLGTPITSEILCERPCWLQTRNPYGIRLVHFSASLKLPGRQKGLFVYVGNFGSHARKAYRWKNTNLRGQSWADTPEKKALKSLAPEYFSWRKNETAAGEEAPFPRLTGIGNLQKYEAPIIRRGSSCILRP